MTEMKVFNIDGIKVSIPMDMFEEACKVYVLDKDGEELKENGNNIIIKHLVIVSYRETLDDLDKITFENVKNNHTEKEISERVQKLLIDEIKINGGHYDIT